MRLRGREMNTLESYNDNREILFIQTIKRGCAKETLEGTYSKNIALKGAEEKVKRQRNEHFGKCFSSKL